MRNVKRKDWDPTKPYFPYLEHVYAFMDDDYDQGTEIARRAITWIGEKPNVVKGQVATVCSGSFRTRDRLKAAKLTTVDLCPHSNIEKETPVHFLAECKSIPRWKSPEKLIQLSTNVYPFSENLTL